jgi:subtilisin family serine protease
MTSKYAKPLLSSALAGALLCVTTVSLAMAGQEPDSKISTSQQMSARTESANQVYIVELAEQPVTAYSGGISGLKATKPQKGQKINPNTPEVVKYMAYLSARHDAALNNVGGGRKLHSYGYVYNGFAAVLTEQQAAALKSSPGVLAITKDEARKLDTATTPDFLGLTAADGAWSISKGENVIIGIVDGGIWPEHPSFSDRTGSNGNDSKDGKLAYQQLPGWHGKCTPGEAFTAANCNQKLIGARYYNAGWGGNAGIDAQMPFEYNSPRDFGGHGTHTASTAGGNEGVEITGAAAVFGSISGIAPRARIAAYKVCWETGSGGSCFSSDSVAAIDQAVADGVDVINFSISGSRTSFRDPVEIAFLFAADAGVFVAASAGNSGPASSTVAHPGPWLTTVAASTHDRNYDAMLTLGNGSSYTGASLNQTFLGLTPMIYAADALIAGGNATAARLCYSSLDGGNALDPALVAGKIVVCDRGNTARVNKSLAVKEAGGIGMVLANVAPSSLNADVHHIPSIHVSETVRADLLAYIGANPGTAEAQLGISYFAPTDAPVIASFSSRGPLLAGSGDVLKPDLTAPGVDIMAGVAPPGNGGELFASYQGTSMSSPHVAGLAALIKQQHPDWSPMAIKSALMTSAYDVLDNVSMTVRIFRQGAGHVQPNHAFDPGVVYDSGFTDWLNFICGTQPGAFCSSFNAIDPSDLNQASIAIGAMAGTQTITRRLTNVSGKALTLSASITGLAGINVVVSPANLALDIGETAEFEVTFTTAGAALNSYTGGFLTWTGEGYNARSPVMVRPVALAAPAEVDAAASGASYAVEFGFTGAFSATPRGMVPAQVTAGIVDQDPDQSFAPFEQPGTTLVMVNVPAGSTYARFALFDTDVAAGSDVDLYVFRPNGSFLGSSGNGGSDEEVNDTAPMAGSYYVFMHGWGLPAGTSAFKLYAWALGATDAGNMVVTAPAAATLGDSGTVMLDFVGLAADSKYLGSVVYGGAAGLPAPTIVRVDTN